jgi:hypothetical protein
MTLGTPTVTLTLSTTGMKADKSYSLGLVVKQDGAGNRNLVFPASVKWQGGYTPTLSTTAGYTDVISMFTIDSGTTWLASFAGKGYI